MKAAMFAAVLIACSQVVVAQDSPAVQAAKAEARRIGERQCEHALIMQRINRTQPGAPERIKAEKELGLVVERARRERERDDRYKASVKAMTDVEQGAVNMVYVKALGDCGVR
jgi:hypothetical protein